ncbi:DUF6891 domain-containing protein [Flexivirga caeni]|uniref:DUF6891 domain-containing protein n=1 Tax=Flexivirga caeni TaxID=2294115 RepID=A0A3M9M6W9_9MICO|nr:hypothetical protein [Flexivirga caeni]RNI20288.1 hypothetical protein EFY87_15155 [Flexivirga caeni]
MAADTQPTDVNFTGEFVPDPDTALGRLMTRICIGTDSREQLEADLRWELARDDALRQADITPESVPEVVDWLIQDHNRQVPFPSQTALGLITGLEQLTAEGVVFGFGEGADVQQALTAVSNAANTLVAEGHSVDGYCFSTIADVERMIFEQRLYVGFGVFNETGDGATRIGEHIARVFTERGLRIEWDGSEDHRIQVLGDYAVPYVDLPDA